MSENQNPTSGEQQAADQTSEAPTQITQAATELKLPPSKPERPHPCQEKKHWLDYMAFGMELLGLIVLCVYAAYTIKIYGANDKSATAAKSAADTAHAALVLSNRPWIKIKHRIVSPLNFDFACASGPAATMTVEDTLENVGNGVALNVVSWEDVISLDPDMYTAAARKRQDEWCNANKRFDPKRPNRLNGYSLFPKDPFVQNSGMGPLMSAVKRAVENNVANGGSLFKGSGPNSLAGGE
jgi:hypothetical protein